MLVMVFNMSIYEKEKFRLIPRNKTRGWKYHVKHESNIIRDSKDNKVESNQKKITDFFIPNSMIVV